MSIQQGLVNTVEAAERLIGEDPDFGPAYLFAGNACMDAGDPDAAEAWFWRGLERQPLQPAIYLALAALRSQRDTQDPFFPALQYLAMAKMGTLTEIPAHFAETFKETADPKTQSEVDFDDPATYQMLATFLEIQEKKAPPPAEVQDRLLPYSLLTRLQGQAGSVVDSMVLQDILDNASRCAPIFHAALKEWARVEASTDETTIAFLMAILAEIGEPSIISDLLEVVLLEHTDLFLHANWAIWRLAQRYPAEALDQFNRAAAGASLPLRCALAEHIGMLPQNPKAKGALLDLLKGFEQVSKKDDGPYLLLAVADALAEHGEERAAEAVFGECEPLLSPKGRRWLKKIVSSEEGFVPRLLQEELDEFTIEDICLERILLDEEEEEDWEEEEDADDEDVFEPPPPLVKPGRNDPCWCGSGNKYKKCHLQEDEGRPHLEIAPPPVKEEEASALPVVGDPEVQRLYRDVLEAAQKRHNKSDFLKATRLYFDKHPSDLNPDEIDSGNFVEWYMYDFRAPSTGLTAVEEYLQRNRSRLTPRERELLEAWRDARYGLFEVTQVEKEKGVEIREHFSDEKIFVHDLSSSRSLNQWDYILMRVESYEGRHAFATTGIVVPRNMVASVVDFINDERKPLRQSGPDFVRANSHRLPRIVRKIHEDWLRNLKVVNAEGDELCFCSSVYTVVDEAGALAALRSIPEFAEDDSPEAGREFRWLEDKTAESTRSYGAVLVQDGRIRLECNSRQRLAKGRKLIEEKAAASLRHMGDTFQSLESVKRQAAAKPTAREPKSDIPADVKNELLLKHKEQHYSKWPDEPLPALGGKTPRQAVKTKAGRKAVEDLLRTFENAESRARGVGEPAFSFSKLRETLGL